jgi:hypothetical protein
MIDCLKCAVLLALVCGFSESARGEDAPAPLPADEAAAQFTAPPGFRTSLFAAEPDVTQPIALTTDGRGRLWVVECLSIRNGRPTAAEMTAC